MVGTPRVLQAAIGSLSWSGCPEVLGFIGSAPTAQNPKNQTRLRGALSIKRLEGGGEAAAGRTHDGVRDLSRGLCILNVVGADHGVRLWAWPVRK